VAAKRVTFTDWRGSLLVYAVIWLTPVYLAWVLTKSWAPWLLAPFIYLVMMAQHKLHRATRMTTAARYEDIDVVSEWVWFLRFMLAAGLYAGLLLVYGIVYREWSIVLGTLAAIATMFMIMLYSGPMHREWWIGVCHYSGCLAAWLMTGAPLTIPAAVGMAGFSALIWMLHKGLRIVTGDYGQVPVEFRHMAEVFVAWAIGVALLLVAFWLTA